MLAILNCGYGISYSTFTTNSFDRVYSVYFLENPNLEELWNITESNLVIERGKAFFHSNPKLCRDKITQIRNLTPEKEDHVDIGEITNGNQATCKQNFGIIIMIFFVCLLHLLP